MGVCAQLQAKVERLQTARRDQAIDVEALRLMVMHLRSAMYYERAISAELRARMSCAIASGCLDDLKPVEAAEKDGG